MARPFIDLKERYHRHINSFLNNKNISKSNKETVKEFLDAKASEGVSIGRLAKIIYSMVTVITKLAPQNFSLKTTSEKSLRPIIAKIEQSDYEEHTKSDLKGIIKQYYKWLNNGKNNPITDFFNTTLKKHKHKLPEDLLTSEEIERFIGVCRNNRDKALIQFLHESGARVGEVGVMKIKNISFDDCGVVATIPQGKTGARRIRVIESERFLRNWLLDHPDKNNGDAYLWVGMHPPFENMDYNSIRMVVQKKAIIAGVKTYKTESGGVHTRVHPHLFRHTRATELAKHLTEQQLKKYLGWTPSSEQASIYVHLSGADVDGAILKMHGIKQDDNIVEEAIKCQSCGHPNASKSKFCGTCCRPLNIEVAVEVDRASQNANKVLQALLTGDVTLDEIKKYVIKTNNGDK